MSHSRRAANSRLQFLVRLHVLSLPAMCGSNPGHPRVALIVVSSYLEHRTLVEAEKAAYPPPGQNIDVDGSEDSLHLYAEGQGEPTLVFLAGFGTRSPFYDFKILFERLSGLPRGRDGAYRVWLERRHGPPQRPFYLGCRYPREPGKLGSHSDSQTLAR